MSSCRVAPLYTEAAPSAAMVLSHHLVRWFRFESVCCAIAAWTVNRTAITNNLTNTKSLEAFKHDEDENANRDDHERHQEDAERHCGGDCSTSFVQSCDRPTWP